MIAEHPYIFGLICAVIGCVLGVLVMALVAVARDADNEFQSPGPRDDGEGWPNGPGV